MNQPVLTLPKKIEEASIFFFAKKWITGEGWILEVSFLCYCCGFPALLPLAKVI